MIKPIRHLTLIFLGLTCLNQIFGCAHVCAEVPKPMLSEKDAIELIDALATQNKALASDFSSQVELATPAALTELDLESQWRGNKPEFSAVASIELWLSVPSVAKVGPLALSQTVVSLTFNSDSVVVSDSTSKIEAARGGIRIPVLSRPRLFELQESADAGMTILVWPRQAGARLNVAMVCPDRNIVRSSRNTHEGYASALGEQFLAESSFSELSISPYRSLYRVAQQSLPASRRHFVAARFGFRGEAAVEVLGAIRPAFAEVGVQTSGQLTKAAALPDSVRAPNPKARLQYISMPQESVLSDAADPLGAAVEFRMRSANPAGFEREALARYGIAMRRIELPRSVANVIGFGEAGETPDWDAGECALITFAQSNQTNYSRETWSAG